MKEHRAEKLETATEEATKFSETIKDPSLFQLAATAQDLSEETKEATGEEDEQNDKEKESKESEEKLNNR